MTDVAVPADEVERAPAGAPLPFPRHSPPQRRRSRRLAPLRELPVRGRPRPDGAVLPAPPARLRSLPLVQLPAYVTRDEIFREYAYFSSYSDSWVEHGRRYVERVAGASVSPSSLAVELASNDGYLLQHFVRSRRSGARHRAGGERRPGGGGARRADGRRVLRAGARADARRGRPAPGSDRREQRSRPGSRPARLRRRIALLLAPDGVVTVEFPHLLRLIEETQFDTIYHEHFSYFSLLTRPGSSRPRAWPSSTSSSSRPTGARCGCTSSMRAVRSPSPRPSPGSPGPRRSAATARSSPTGAFAPGSRRSSATCWSS